MWFKTTNQDHKGKPEPEKNRTFSGLQSLSTGLITSCLIDIFLYNFHIVTSSSRKNSAWKMRGKFRVKKKNSR